MSEFVNIYEAPMGDDSAPAQLRPQTLEGTGLTETYNAAPLTRGGIYDLTVGTVPVRVLFSRVGGQSNFVPPTGGHILPANQTFTFRAIDEGTYGSTYVYVEAADGSSAYKASLCKRNR